MKKMLAVVSAAAMAVSMAACSNSSGTSSSSGTTAASGESGSAEVKSVSKDDIKVGLICLHDENSTYDVNFINALNEVKAELGLKDEQVIIRKNVSETDECYNAACDLVDRGCNVIFADSFGHESYVIQAAEKYPDVQFCHATGTRAHTENKSNYHNAFASIYEGRYLAGVAAGLKLNEMIDNGDIKSEEAVMGYVGAYPYAEVISGFSSFYLGAKSVCESVTMKVQFTSTWYDETLEKEAANTLMSKGCVLISQHADSMGAPTACEAKNVPNVSYNGSTVDACPNTFIVSSRINWAPYFKTVIESVIDGKVIPTDYVGTLDGGSVQLTEVNTKAAAADTQKKLDEVAKGLKDGSIKVFDTANFTVDGAKLTTYKADVDQDEAYEADTEVIENGIFLESAKRSAPYFDIKIDGIEWLNGN